MATKPAVARKRSPLPEDCGHLGKPWNNSIMTIQWFRPDRATRLRRRPSFIYTIIYIALIAVGMAIAISGSLLIALRR
jgi:hypothetical protein